MQKPTNILSIETFYLLLPSNYDLLAQLVEHNTFNVGVLGSSPKQITERPPVPFGIRGFLISSDRINVNGQFRRR